MKYRFTTSTGHMSVCVFLSSVNFSMSVVATSIDFRATIQSTIALEGGVIRSLIGPRNRVFGRRPFHPSSGPLGTFLGGKAAARPANTFIRRARLS